MLALRALSELAFPSAGHNKVIFSLLLSHGADTEASGWRTAVQEELANEATDAHEARAEVVAMVAALEV